MYYHEAHLLIEELMDATLDERRKKHMLDLQTAPLLIIDDWGKVLGDNAAVTAMLDRLLHHAHVIKTGPPSRRTWDNVSLRDKAAESYSKYDSERLHMAGFRVVTEGWRGKF